MMYIRVSIYFEKYSFSKKLIVSEKLYQYCSSWIFFAWIWRIFSSKELSSENVTLFLMEHHWIWDLMDEKQMTTMNKRVSSFSSTMIWTISYRWFRIKDKLVHSRVVPWFWIILIVWKQEVPHGNFLHNSTACSVMWRNACAIVFSVK